MKILVICQYYYPEPFRITDICEELAKGGHEVFVITGLPNYPIGEIYEDYKDGQRRDEIINGVKVHRCYTIGRKGGVVKRFLNYYSYAVSSSMYTSRLKEEFDVVFVNQLSPVMMASAGIRYKKKHCKKLILYCLDLWPESLAAGGISRKSLIFRLFHKISARIYRQADEILVTSKSFDDYLYNEFQISKEKIQYLPQYAEDIFNPETCRKKPNETVDLMFAGNIGAAQSIDTIIRTAAETRDIKNLRWHIVGDGSELENMKKLASKLCINSVIFHGRKPIEEMPKYYAMSDAMLVTMKNDPVISLTLPGKVQSYMAAGKPIIGAINGETQRIICESQSGVCANAEDAEGLSACVREFVLSNRKVFADNSINYYNGNYTKEGFISRLQDILSENDS